MSSGHISNLSPMALSPEQDHTSPQYQHTLICINLGVNEAPCLADLDTPVTIPNVLPIRFPEHIVAFNNHSPP